MSISFNNDYAKHWLARKGPAKIFGWDVDHREQMVDEEAVQWFDRVWNSPLQREVERATPCTIEFVRSKVANNAQNFINEKAQHREFTLAECFFICQLPTPQTCDQLWFIPSRSGDPRTLYVKFRTVPIKEAFDRIAKRSGWERPEELGEKILLDFMESVTRTDYRSGEPRRLETDRPE